ncbi:MAG TPA: hypothetical protein VMK65_05235 [Longimicrobiales bacterium]|nr:hypothetical protein [Longimicrobiales bacterium]
MTKNRAAGTRVELRMGGNGECLDRAVRLDAAQLHVTSSLGMHGETEATENRDDLRAGEARSLGMRREELHRDNDGWIFSQTQGRQIFVGEVKDYRFLEVFRDFVQGDALSDHGDFKAFGYVSRLLARPDDRLDRALKHFCSPCRAQYSSSDS